ncbi:MAG: arginine--tRNA ligase [Planctomycetes bacterium]|nr:arginine--tRNA ligase [Planctomycetota bacterium]
MTVSPLQQFQRTIAGALASSLGVDATAILLEKPRDANHGDVAFPCFRFAKERGVAPPALAAKLAGDLASALPSVSAKPAGPFLNFTIDRAIFARELLPAAFRADFGGAPPSGEVIVLDYSSPNIAKRFHVGHLRSTVIGAAVKRICEARGARVVGINHLGDWGSQFGKLLTALRRFGSEADLDKAVETEGPWRGIEYLQDVYVQYHIEEKKGADAGRELAAESRKWFLELESGADNEARRLWKKLTSISMKEFERIYQKLGVTFDEVRGESAYEKDLAPTIEMCKKAGVTRVSEGALVIEIDGQEKPALLQTGDGTTLYLTRDLASVFYRKNTYHFTKAVYVVGGDQLDHFKELAAVVKKLGHAWSGDIVHAHFGMMRLPEGKMSTREGNVIILSDLIDSAVDKVNEIMLEKNPNFSNTNRNSGEVAEQVGIGAIIYHDLKQDRRRDIVFKWDDVLNFDGDTGPYCQYTHARLASILKKSGRAISESDLGSLNYTMLADAGPLLMAIARFPAAVEIAAARFEPHHVAQSAFDIAQASNAFYRDHRVLDAPSPEVVAARLAIVEAARRTLERSLQLLGIAAPREM